MLWHGGPRYKSEARIGVSSLLGRLLTKSAEKAVVGCSTVFDRKYILVCNKTYSTSAVGWNCGFRRNAWWPFWFGSIEVHDRPRN